MIKDNETNFLYLADCLPVLHSKFYKKLNKLLKRNEIDFSLLPETKDIWAVDFMPIQLHKDLFIQFTYNPDYLQTKTLKKTISDVSKICSLIDINPLKSNILLDGGNVTRSTKKVIMTDKVFKENSHLSISQVIRELENAFQVDKIIFIPTHPNDFTGHADGMVRFLDENTVLINDYSKEKNEFQIALNSALYNAGIKTMSIPYNPYLNKNYTMARGEYINYLQMKNLIILPIFGMKEDEEVVRIFERIFVQETIQTIDCNEIGKKGGLLNCITWNIMR